MRESDGIEHVHVGVFRVLVNCCADVCAISQKIVIREKLEPPL